MLLAIDAGNTNVVFALVEPGGEGAAPMIHTQLAHRDRSPPHRR
jgi:pantothenate kinase type III